MHQVAGGFARYSTDQRWLVPHFERMLCDNARLAAVFGEAFSLYYDVTPGGNWEGHNVLNVPRCRSRYVPCAPCGKFLAHALRCHSVGRLNFNNTRSYRWSWSS